MRFKKAGGGFLNGETAVLVGYKFESKVWPGGKGKDDYTTLSVELEIQQDGADEPVSQFLPAGFLYEGQGISEDGLTLEPEDNEAIIAENSDFARFLTTLVESEFDESEFPEDGYNFEAMIGRRLTFAKELNKERQLASGKKKLGAKAAKATEAEIMEAGKRQDPNDKKKSYNHDRLIVVAVLPTGDQNETHAETESEARKGKAGPATGPTRTRSTSRANGSGRKNNKRLDADAGLNEALEDSRAEAVLLDLLADAKDNTIQRSSVSSLIVRKALADDMDTETRETLRKLIFSEEFLSREAGWTYDGSGKRQVIALIG